MKNNKTVAEMVNVITKDKDLTLTPQKKIKLKNILENGVEKTLYKQKNLQEICEAKQINLDWTKNKVYKVITSKQELLDFFKAMHQIYLTAPNTLIGFDTETTGLQVNGNSLDILVGLTISFAKDTGFYFPINHINMENIDTDLDKFMNNLKKFISVDGAFKLPLVTHNGKFDYKVMKHYGIDLNIQEDTYIKHSLMKNTDSKTFGSLKVIAKEKLDIDVVELTDMYVDVDKTTIELTNYLVQKGYLETNEITAQKLAHLGTYKSLLAYDFRYASKDFVELYGSADGDFPLQILEMQNKEWNQAMNLIYEIELKTIKTLAEQEFYGIKIDIEGIENEGLKLEQELADLEQEIFTEIGREFSLTSNKQLGEYIYGELGIKINPKFRTATGVGQVNNKALEYFAKTKEEDGSLSYPILKKILNHKKLTKRITDFFKKLPRLEVKGKLNPSYNQLGTDTGRISCKEPNIQQTEQGIRQYITTDTKDDYMIVCDYSQVEYRILGGLSDEANISDFFSQNENADIHTLSYANMNNVPYNTVTSSQRKIGKILNFGTTYGLQDESLSEQLNNGHTTVLHQQMANESRRKYFEGIPRVSTYFTTIREEARKTKQISTLFGRVRHIEEFSKENPTQGEIASGERKVTNTNIQGTGADILKLAMIRIRELLNKYEIPMDDVQMRINVHDEIALHVNKKYNPYFMLTLMREAMEIDLSDYGIPPLYIGATIGSSWGECGNEDIELPVGLLKELTYNGFNKHEMIVNDDVTVEDHKNDWKSKLEKFHFKTVEEEIISRLTKNNSNLQESYLVEIIQELVTENDTLSRIITSNKTLNKSIVLYNNLLHLVFILNDKDIKKMAEQSIVFGSDKFSTTDELITKAYVLNNKTDVPSSILMKMAQFIIKNKLIEAKGLKNDRRSYIELDKIENYFSTDLVKLNKLVKYVEKYVKERYAVIKTSSTYKELKNSTKSTDELNEMIGYVLYNVIGKDSHLNKLLQFITSVPLQGKDKENKDMTFTLKTLDILVPECYGIINKELQAKALEIYNNNFKNNKGLNKVLFEEEINLFLNGNVYGNENDDSYGLWKTFENSNIFSKNTPYKLSDSVVVDKENKEIHINFHKANSEAINLLLKIAISHKAMRKHTDNGEYANELLTPVINYGIYDSPHKIVGYGLLDNHATISLFEEIINEDYTELGAEFDYEAILAYYTEEYLLPYNCKYIK